MESAFFYKNYNDFDDAQFYLVRFEKESLLPRSGGIIGISEKRVLIVGSGSVGALIALNLARVGVGKMTICDPESFSHENIFRHPLGVPFMEKNKAMAMKSQIEALIPFCSITALSEKIENIDFEEFAKYDLVVFATGNPTSNRFVSEQIRKEGISTKLIYAWNEPFGLGGHALLTHSLSKGCYSCLYDENLHNRALFCSEFQPKSFVKSLAGCSGNFVPFGYLDSSRTAELASRIAIDVLTIGYLQPQLKSWKGDCKQFLAEGYNLSERYTSFSEEQLLSGTSSFVNIECLNCSIP
jgi:molybdopterin/thiamine biosynthesis adenylyltransferase